jgi:hypothetical protein
MSKLVSVVALLSLVTWSVPAFAQGDCVAWCNQRCGGKGNLCMINCQRNSPHCVPKSK